MKSLKQRQQLEGYLAEYDPRMRYAEKEFMEQDVNRPKHYTFSKIEVIDAIEEWNLNFRLANVVKYIVRSPHKRNRLKDLLKARFYLEREIHLIEKELGISD